MPRPSRIAANAPDLFGKAPAATPAPRLPPAPQQAAQPVHAPHLAPILRSRGQAFMHPCSVCGATLAPFGDGYSGRGGKLGTWYCRAHLPAGYRTALSLPSETTP